MYRLILFVLISIILVISIVIGTGIGSYLTFSIDQLKQIEHHNSLSDE